MKQQQGGRLWGLDLLKFLCAVVILNWHIVPTEAMRFWFTGKIVNTFLMCSGYVWCLSLDRRQAGLKQYYQKSMWRHLVQILLPYALLFLAEVFYHSFWITWTKDPWLWLDYYAPGEEAGYFRVREMLGMFWQGGPGPGGYYVGYLLQLVVLFGLIYQLGKRFPRSFFAATVVLLLVSSVYQFRLWQACRWFVEQGLGIRPLLQDQMLIVLMGVGMYHNRQRLPRWGWAPVLLLAAGAQWAGWGITDPLQAWGAFWLALELSRLRLPGPVTTLIGHLGRASYFIFLMQKAYCASAIGRWLAIRWELYGGWNILLCLVLGLGFYGVYTLAGTGMRLLWNALPTRRSRPDAGTACC